jgi:hypothetical protein
MHTTSALSPVVMTQEFAALGSIRNGSPNMEPSRKMDVAMADRALQRASAGLAITVGGPCDPAADERSVHFALAALQDWTFGSFDVGPSAIIACAFCSI